MCTTSSFQLHKGDIERRIEEKDASISYAKPKEANHMSKYWSQFSQIYVTDIKQDFIIWDFCTLFNFALYSNSIKLVYVFWLFFLQSNR